jgi:ABC-type histidine transport system ATPase subunit
MNWLQLLLFHRAVAGVPAEYYGSRHVVDGGPLRARAHEIIASAFVSASSTSTFRRRYAQLERGMGQ